jgi:hypothetical protein
MASTSRAAPPLATVVSYCSNERNLIDALLRNALEFSDRVYVSVGTRLYTGEPESADHIDALRRAHPEVTFLWYDVDPSDLSDPIRLHNRARTVGVDEAKAELGGDCWVLMLDGDEVPEGARVREWLAAALPALTPDVIVKLANYWLFLDPRVVADAHEDSVMLAHASALTSDALSHPRERDGVYQAQPRSTRLQRGVTGLDGKPMFWHFSWVRRSRDALKAKVRNWGHRHDRDWASLIDAAFDDLDRGVFPTRDFVHGYNLAVLSAPAHGWTWS